MAAVQPEVEANGEPGLDASDSSDEDFVPEEEPVAGKPAKSVGAAPPRREGGLKLDDEEEDADEDPSDDADEEEEPDEDDKADAKAEGGGEVGDEGVAAGNEDGPPQKKIRLADKVDPTVSSTGGAILPRPAGDNVWATMNRQIAKPVSRARSAPMDPALARLLGGGSSSASRPRSKQTTPARMDPSLAALLSKKATPVQTGEVSDPVTVAATPGSKSTALPSVSSSTAEPSLDVPAKAPVKKIGLEGVLGALRGSKQPNVLDRTRDAWKGFKEGDEKVAEELDAYKKDKNRYTDKVAFLERTDKREWEADMARKSKR